MDRGQPLSKTHGWEEAGGEFYQENYSTDLESQSKSDYTLSSILPSKQKRYETNKRIRNRRQELHNRKYLQSYVSAKKKISLNDIKFSELPDLSLVHTDEERIWEEVLQIKLLPVSMQKKKELKANLQRSTKLRLQGLNQFKWKHRKAWKKINLKWAELMTRLELWKSSLKQIEGHFGTGVLAYFMFLRWLFFMNFFTFILLLLFLIVPNIFATHFDIHFQRNLCVEKAATMCLPELNHSESFTIDDFIYIFKSSKYSLIFYGGYTNKTIHNSFTNSTTMGTERGLSYNIPFAYIFVIIAYFFLTLVSIVKTAAIEFRDRLINGKWQLYQCCNLVFCGWDFCIYNKKSADIKNNAISYEMKYLVQSKCIEIEKKNRSREFMYNLILKRIIVNIFVLLVLIISVCFIYFLFNISINYQHVNSANKFQYGSYNNVSILTNFMVDGFEKSTEYLPKQMGKFFIDFIPYIVIVSLNITLPSLFKYLCTLEKYSPLFVVKICLFRMVFLRVASLSILLSRFYYIVIPHSGRSYACWETLLGQQFYKLIITDFVGHLLVTFCINFPRALCAQNIHNSFIKLLGEQEFELPKHVLDIVYFQIVCWIGTFYSPFLPALATSTIFCMFYIKKFQCLVNSKPSTLFYGASNSNSLFMIILLISFFVALVPLMYTIVEISPSLNCGPLRDFSFAWDVPVSVFIKLPKQFKSFVFFFGTGAFIIPCFIVLSLLLYYFYAVSDANKHMVAVLKNQLVLEGHDKQFLLTRLSEFLKQSQNLQGINTDAT